MASVCVLAPNGRRQTVKCSPNTTILQILEDVCKKQGFEPENYDLKHHNKVLDTTTTFRFSGLPNNAQLELVNAVKTRADAEVTLAVSLEDGNRPMGNFKPSHSLLDVLQQLCPENVGPGKHPVIIFTRREIYGDDLAKTTLRNLGLTGGRAMVRLIDRYPEELRTQANVSAPLPSKPSAPDVKETYCKKQTSDEKEPEPKKESSPPKEIARNRKKSASDDNVASQPPPKVQPKQTIDYMKLAKEKRKLEFKPSSTDVDKKSRSQDDDTKPQEESMEVDEVVDVPNDVGNSKPKEHHVPKPKINVDEEFVFVGDRNAMVFSLESAHSVPVEELPDDFFELTISDAQSILRDIKRKRAELENGGPLLTEALRNLEESKKQLRQLNRYRKAVIRVQFPNRTILQGVFQPTDTVADVMNFVRDYLEDKNLDFYLYTAPPKCILNKDSRLIEANCVPGALLYFGLESIDSTVQYLRKDLNDKFTTNSVASLAATVVRQQSTRPDSAMDTAATDDAMEATSSTINSGPTPSTSGYAAATPARRITPSENVPKWFKPSKK